MDGFVLRCNSLRCRAPLSTQGVVTTCSHLYCTECANKLFTTEKICPACETSLPEPDDVVVTNLNPTELQNGLSPSIVMEICARALSFFTYQSTQEIVYQEFITKTLQEKNISMSAQLDNMIRDANNEIGLLRNKIAFLETEQLALKRKSLQLNDTLQEKTRQYAKLQNVYDKLKRKSLISPLQHGAFQNTDGISPSSQAPRGRLGVDSTFSASTNSWSNQTREAANTARQRIVLNTGNDLASQRRSPLRPYKSSSEMMPRNLNSSHADQHKFFSRGPLDETHPHRRF